MYNNASKLDYIAFSNVVAYIVSTGIYMASRTFYFQNHNTLYVYFVVKIHLLSVKSTISLC